MTSFPSAPVASHPHFSAGAASGQTPERARGLTLVELLVVMAILATLGGLAAIGIPRMLRQADRSAVEAVILQLHAVLTAYAEDPRNGDFPPTVLDKDDFPGVGQLSNLENCGIEAVMLCLNRRGLPPRFEPEGLKGVRLENLDGDRTQVCLTSYGSENRELYELMDIWGTPLAYFHHRDYDVVESRQLDRILGPEDVVKARPWTNPQTRTWYNRNTFQLISAGPDCLFNTEDDITNFDRQ